MKKSLLLCTIAALLTLCAPPCRAQLQQFAVGADVSFLAQAEQQGVVFKDNGVPKPALEILRSHGFNWVRLRIFVHPTDLPNDLPYTLALAKRAKALGFHLLLDFHYSDTWADPGKQFLPTAWKNLKHKQLANAIFAYTRDTLIAFRNAGVYPEMVQTGNEITNGMDWPDGKLPDNWDHFADLLRAAIAGVDASRGSLPRSLPRPLLMIHIDRSGDPAAAVAFYNKLLDYRIPWDVIGLSYYPHWHGSIATLRQTLHDLAFRFRKPIVVVETAYNWTPGDFIGKKAPFPESPQGQRDFLAAVNAAVRATPQHLGRGVFWWEPAVAGGPLAGRALFDSNHNALPAMSVFDNPATTPMK